jgi:spermidine synthase
MPSERRPARVLLVACLFASGAAALTLELVWSRSLRLVFGSSTLAVSTVLAAYMLGLGLGGLAAGRLAGRLRHPARAYGLVEVGIGIYAWFVPALLAGLPALEVMLAGVTGPNYAALIRFPLVLAVLLVPTSLMGATLPLLVAASVGMPGQVARGVGLLYGVNTLGAVTGILAATFVFLPQLGLAATNRLGAVLALAVGAVAIALVAPPALATRSVAPAPVAAAAGPPRAAARWNRWLLAYATVGFTALAYEVCWFRALSMVVGSSIYAFASMLAAFLLGIALGSLAARHGWQRLRHPEAAWALGLAALGASAWVTVVALGAAPRWFVRIVDVAGVSPASIAGVSALIAVAAMLAPTLLLGALFPGVLRLVAADRTPPAAAGDVYFVNTVGSALGACAAGFVLIPYLGLQASMALLVAVNLAVAAWLLAGTPSWPRRRRIGAAVAAALGAVAVLVFPPPWNPVELNRGVYQLLLDADDWRVDYEALAGVEPDGLRFLREGVNTTVAVEQRGGERVLRVNGKPDAGSAGDMSTQVLLGQLPFLFGARAERVMVIGLASGVSAGSAGLFAPDVLDIVELEPAMVEASRFFDDVNNRPLDRAGARVIVEDGRLHLARRPAAYDVIISEPSNPWISGVANLFTREFFRAARAALRPDGVLLQWVQLYGLAPEAWTSILAALGSEFPYLYVFSHSGLTGGDSLVLAAQRPLAATDFPRWEDLNPAVRADLERVGLFDTADLWSLLRLGPEEVGRLAAQAPVVNSDDNLFVELAAPRTLHDAEALAAVRERLAGFRRGVLPLLESAGIRLGDEETGELALAYATGRREVTLARAMLAERPAMEAWAKTLEAMILVRSTGASAADRREARALLEAAGALRPGSLSLKRHRATVLQDLGDLPAALADIEGYLRVRPDHVGARSLQVRLQFALGNLAAARSGAEHLLAAGIERHDSELRMLAALAAARLGDLPAAIAHVRMHLAAVPYDTHGWQMLGELLEATDGAGAAREAWANAARAQRNRGRQHYVAALRLQRFGRSEEAAAELRAAAAEFPEVSGHR